MADAPDSAASRGDGSVSTIAITVSTTARVAAARNNVPATTASTASVATMNAIPWAATPVAAVIRIPHAVEKTRGAGRAGSVTSSPSPHWMAAIGYQLDGLIQRAVSPPGHHVDTDCGHVAIHTRALQLPHSSHQRVVLVLERRAL